MSFLEAVKKSIQGKSTSGRKKVGTIKGGDLPEDLQVLILQWAEEFNDDQDEIEHIFNDFENMTFPVYEVPVDAFDHDVEMDPSRGPEHAREMDLDKTPPVVIAKGVWVDGRHRVYKAREEGRKTIKAMDVSSIYPNLDPKKNQIMGALKEAEEYQTGHTAPTKESGAPLWDVTRNGTYPKDFYGPRGHEYASSDGSMAVFHRVRNLHNMPNKQVKIYRAVYADIPKEKRKINQGDWVALNRAYAVEHGKSNLSNNYKIITKTVYARDLFTYGDSLEEWGYDPQPRMKEEDIFTPEEVEKRKVARKERQAKAKADRQQAIKDWLEKKMPKQRNGKVYLWVVAYDPYDPDKGVSAIDQFFVEEEDARKALTRHKVLYSAWFPISDLEYSRVRGIVRPFHGTKAEVDKVIKESSDPGDFEEDYDNEPVIMEKDGIRYVVDHKKYPSAAMAFDGDKKVGFLYTNDEYETPRGPLLNIFNTRVLDEYQRRGIAKNMYRTLLKAMADSGVFAGLFSCDADVCSNNIYSIRSSIGFEPYTVEREGEEDIEGAVAWADSANESHVAKDLEDTILSEARSKRATNWRGDWEDKLRSLWKNWATASPDEKVRIEKEVNKLQKSIKGINAEIDRKIEAGLDHEVTQEDFINYHMTGFLQEDAYTTEGTKEYLEKYYSGAENKAKLKPVKTIQTPKGPIEIRVQVEKNQYVAHDENDDIKRDERGMAVMMTDEEIKKAGKQTHDYLFIAYDGDKAVGEAANEYGVPLIRVIDGYQKLGIGLELLKLWMEKRGKGQTLGQMSAQGMKLAGAYHKDKVKAALAAGKKVPAEVLKDYPDLAKDINESNHPKDIKASIDFLVQRAREANLNVDGGNCGSFAIAAKKWLENRGYNVDFFIVAPSGAEDYWDHVALEVDGIIFDGNGITTSEELEKKYAYEDEELMGVAVPGLDADNILDNTDCENQPEEFEKAFNHISESVTSIDGNLERDDVVQGLVDHAKKHHDRLYPDQSDEEAIEMGMDPGRGGGAYYRSKKEMDEKIDCVFKNLSELPDPIPVWRVLRLDPDMTYYRANSGVHWSFRKESALKFGKNERATHIVSGEVRKHSVNWMKTIERNIIFSCTPKGEEFDDENEIYVPAGKVRAKKIEPINKTTLSENLTLKPGSSPRQTSVKPLVYLTMEERMAQAYAAGFVSDAHVMRPSSLDGVIFTIEASDELREAGGDVWQAYRDDLQEGAKLWVEGERDEYQAHNFNNFVESTMGGEDVDEMAALAAENPDELLRYMEPMSWMFHQIQEHGYSELAVREVPWDLIISIKEYEDGELTHVTKGGSSEDEDAEDLLYHGAPLQHWQKILEKLPGRRAATEEDLEESSLMEAARKGSTLTAYHGTSTKFIPSIRHGGLKDPYLAATPELAEYYAEEVVAEHGGDEVVLEIKVTDFSKLRYDSASMDEPVMASDEDRDAQWEKAEKEHPEWVHDDVISIPPGEWKYSWDGVGAVRYNGIIMPSQIDFDDDVNEAKKPAANTMSREEMADWIVANKLQDGWGKIDEDDAYEIARKTNSWKLQDIPLKDLEESSPGSFPARKGRKDLPIIVLKFEEGEYEVLDGKHRVAEARHAGKDTIKAWVADWTLDESKQVGAYLLEARVEDVRSKGFNEFLEKYSGRMPKGLRKKDLFVRFTQSAANKIMPITVAHHDPTAVYAYPLDFVIENPMDVNYGSNMDWIQVLKLKSGAILELQGMTEREAYDLLNRAGASTTLFKKKRNEFKRNPPRQMFVGRLTSPMGLAFMYAMQHRDESSPDELLSGPEQRKRFLKTGYDAVRDNSKRKGGSIINPAEPQQIFFLTKDSYEVVDKFYIGSGRNTLGKGAEADTEHLMGKLAANIAKQLGEKKIVWQKEKPNHNYNKWDSYQAWIGDDYLFLAHTETDPEFKDEEGMFRSPEHRERGYADMDRFIVKLVGPEGTAEYTSGRHSTLDSIANQVMKKYKESPDKSKTIEGRRKADFIKKADDAWEASIKKDRDEKTAKATRFVKAAKYFGVDVPMEAARSMEDAISNAVMQTAIHRKKQPFDDHKMDEDLYNFMQEREGKSGLSYKEFNKLAEKLYDKVVAFMEKHNRLASPWDWMAYNFAKGKNPFDESVIESAEGIEGPFYHGTSRPSWEKGEGSRLYLTTHLDDAWNYAYEEAARDEEKGLDPEPIVVKLSAEDIASYHKFVDDGWQDGPDDATWIDSMNAVGSFAIQGNIDALKDKGETLKKESTLASIIEALKQRAPVLAQQFGKKPEEVLAFGNIDPTPGGKYVGWILKMEKEGHLRFPEDRSKVKETLKQFAELSRKGTWKGPKDLNQYKDYGSLSQAIQDNEGIESNQDVRKKHGTTEGLELIRKSGQFAMYYLDGEKETIQASKGTRWCVKDPEWAHKYLRHGHLYVITKGGERYALLFVPKRNFSSRDDEKRWDLRNVHDSRFSGAQLEEIKKFVIRSLPNLQKKHNLFSFSEMNDLSGFLNLFNLKVEDLPSMKSAILTKAYKSIERMSVSDRANLALDTGDRLPKELEQEFLDSDSRLIEKYRKRFKLTGPDDKKDALKLRRYQDAPGTLIQYAIDIRKERWPELEALLQKQFTRSREDYEKEQRRYRHYSTPPGGERSPYKAMTHAARYADHFRIQDWPELERAIAKSGDHIQMMMWAIERKKRMPEVEKLVNDEFADGKTSDRFTFGPGEKLRIFKPGEISYMREYNKLFPESKIKLQEIEDYHNRKKNKELIEGAYVHGSFWVRLSDGNVEETGATHGYFVYENPDLFDEIDDEMVDAYQELVTDQDEEGLRMAEQEAVGIVVRGGDWVRLLMDRGEANLEAYSQKDARKALKIAIDSGYISFPKKVIVDAHEDGGYQTYATMASIQRFLDGKPPTKSKLAQFREESMLIEAAKLSGYTFRVKKDTNEGDVLIIAYKGKKKAGHISALEVRNGEKGLRDKCLDDVARAKKAVGRESVKVFEVWKSHLFTKEERGEDHRGVGVGAAMYAKMIEEVGKRGAILVAGGCSNIGTSSKDAQALWDNSKTIRAIAHVFGHVAAWKGLENLTEKDEAKGEAMRTMQRRWVKTPTYLRSKDEFRKWGTDIVGYDPDWIEEFLKDKKDTSPMIEAVKNTETVTWGRLMDALEPEQWIQDQYGWDEVFIIRPLTLEKLKNLTTMRGISLKLSLEDDAAPEQKKLVARYRKIISGKGFPGLENVIIVDGDRVLDGHHRAVAAQLENKPNLRYVDVGEDPDDIQEGKKSDNPGIPSESELRKIRSFLKEKKWDKGSSHNQCQRATWFLHRLYGGTIKGGWPKDGPRELNAGYLCKGITCPDGEWAFHYWLEKDGHIIDITSDQFVGGKDVVITKVGDPRYKAVSTQKDVEHDFKFTKQKVDPWVEEWKEEQNLQEGVSVSSWASYGKDDLTVRINGKSEPWEWLVDGGRPEIVDNVHAAYNIKQALKILRQYARPKVSSKPAKKHWDGPRCPHCGTPHNRGTSKCPNCDEMISEAKQQDVLDATHRLQDSGLTDRFWKAFNANSDLYHNKRKRIGASEEETVAYAGKVSEVLRPEVLEHVAKSAHNVPVYITYRIEGDAAHGDWNGKESIFVRPGARAWILWYLLHEVKHAIDKAKGHATLTDPDLSTPDKYKAYKKHPAERRAEAFAKRVIMRAAPEKKPSLIEAAKLITKSREEGHRADHRGVFGWFDVYGGPSTKGLPIKKIKQQAEEATKQLGKLGFGKQRRVVVVNNMGKDGVNHITGIKGGNAGYADAKNHGIWILPKHFNVDTLVHEWLHMFYKELPKSQKAKWLNFWEHFVKEGLTKPENEYEQEFQAGLKDIAQAKTLNDSRLLMKVEDDYGRHYADEFAPSIIHGAMRDLSPTEEMREKIAYLGAIAAFGIHPEAKLSKDVTGPKRQDKGRSDSGRKGEDVDIYFNGEWHVMDEIAGGSLVNARILARSNDPEEIAEVIDLESLKKGMAGYIAHRPEIQDFVDELMKRTKDPDKFGGTFYAYRKAYPKKLESMAHRMASSIISAIQDSIKDGVRVSGLSGPGETYELDTDKVIKDWGDIIDNTPNGTGIGTNGALAIAVAKHLDPTLMIKKANQADKKAKRYGVDMGKLGKPEGEKERRAVADRGFTARAYGAANKDELWTTTGEALAQGHKINPRLKKAFLAMIKGGDPMRASGFLESTAIMEAIHIIRESVSIHELGDDYVERLRGDFNTLMKNVSKVEKADDIVKYFDAIHKFRERLELMTGPYSSWVRGLTIDETPLRKLFYKLDKRDQIANFGSWYTKALYDLMGELSIGARWDARERGDSYAEFWWKNEKGKWKNRTQRKARKLWKDLKAAFQAFDLEGERVRVPEEDVEEIHGHPTVIIGYDPDEPKHKKRMQGIKQGIKQAKDVIGKKFPSLLPQSLPIVINFDPKIDVGGTYLHAFGGPNAPAIEISAYQDNPKEAEKIIIHEAAHYYWKRKLKEEARAKWSEVYRANMAGRLSLKKVKKYWDENPDMKWLHQVMDNTSMKVEDPQLYLQLNYLVNNGRRTGFDIHQRDDLEQAIKDEKVWVVPKQPVTWYAGKNAEELFTESVATYLGYGDRAMPDFILGVLKDIIGSPLKEGYLVEAYQGLTFDDDAGTIDGYEVDADEPNFRNWITNLLGKKGDAVADYVKENASTVAVLKNMYVDEEARGQGIGTSLMDEFMENTTADMVFLEADQGEEQAPGFSLVKWYEGYDFETFADASGNPVMVYPAEHAEALKALKESVLNEARFDKVTTQISRELIKRVKEMTDSDRISFQVNDHRVYRVEVEVDIDPDNEKFDIDGQLRSIGNAKIMIIWLTLPKFWRVELDKYLPKIKELIAHEFEHTHDKESGEDDPYPGQLGHMLNPVEMNAMLAGFMKEAKTRKVPFMTVVDEAIEKAREMDKEDRHHTAAKRRKLAQEIRTKILAAARKRFPKMVEESANTGPDFDKWFKGSKIVDASGEPLLVMHGSTSNKVIDRFDSKYGTYFTTDEDYATTFTQKSRPAPNKKNMYYAYLKVTKPEVFDGENEEEFETYTHKRESDADVIARGYDGQILKFDDGHMDIRVTDPDQIWIARSPDPKDIEETVSASMLHPELLSEEEEKPNLDTEDPFMDGLNKRDARRIKKWWQQNVPYDGAGKSGTNKMNVFYYYYVLPSKEYKGMYRIVRTKQDRNKKEHCVLEGKNITNALDAIRDYKHNPSPWGKQIELVTKLLGDDHPITKRSQEILRKKFGAKATVYRGGESVTGHASAGWSTDPDIAIRFALDADGEVCKGTVKVSDVLYYDQAIDTSMPGTEGNAGAGMDEDEVILKPGVQVDITKCVDVADEAEEHDPGDYPSPEHLDAINSRLIENKSEEVPEYRKEWRSRILDFLEENKHLMDGVRVFGSIATGKAYPGDVDLMFPKGEKKRAIQVAQRAKYGKPCYGLVDVFVENEDGTLLCRNEESTGLIVARNAKGLKASFKKQSTTVDEAISVLKKNPEAAIVESAELPGETEDYISGGCGLFAVALARAYGYKLGVWNDVESGEDYVAHIYAINAQGKPVDVTGVWPSEEEMAEEIHGVWGTYSDEYTFDELNGEQAVKAINDDIMVCKWDEKLLKKLVDYVKANPDVYGPKATKRIDLD